MVVLNTIDFKATFDSACNLACPSNVIENSGCMCCVAQIHQVEWEAIEFLHKEAMVFEELLQVSQQWTPHMTEWHDAVKCIQIRDYQLVVDKLEVLMVSDYLNLPR